MRYFFMCAIVVLIVFSMWSQYNFISRQYTLMLSSEIETLASKIQDIDDKDNKTINETKASVVEIFNYNDSESYSDIDIKSPDVLKALIDVDMSMKVILIWTQPNYGPLKFLLNNNSAFILRKCKVINCYVTTDKAYLGLTEFDVVIFNGQEVIPKKHPRLPNKRLPRQKYVFASIESSDYYPICDNKFDGYFNITWTYKLNSDIFFGYIIIRNIEGDVIGPQKVMHWMTIDEMKPTNETIKQKLSTKTKLAAWFVSNCNAPSGRDEFVKNVQVELNKTGTNMTVDVYGSCGKLSCARYKMHICLQNYYFYFAFENSFTEDYVTEKLLLPLRHYAVPVVYGTANYTRFMPDGIYLNALKLGPEQLVIRMLDIVADKEQYYSYFKWMNHYSYHHVEEVPETDFYCKFCEAMNDENLMSTATVIDNFKEWWNPPTIRKNACPARL